MPNSKNPKKKKKIDEKQKSLFSYMDTTKPHQKETKKETAIKEETPITIVDEPEAKVVRSSEQKLKVSQTKVPEKLFFSKKAEDFGLKAKEIQLNKITRESLSSKYIRYLMATGDIVQNLEKGLLLDVDYDGGQNKAYCKFYDLENHDIKIWIDTTNHEPYCLTKETDILLLENLKFIDKVGDIQQEKKLVNYSGFNRFESIKRFDLLSDKEIDLTKIYGKTPSDIGGSGVNIRSILERNDLKAWEADIRYHLNYIFDRQLVPGLIYSIQKGKIQKIDYEDISGESKKLATELRTIFENEESEIKEFAEKFIDIFLTPIPDVKRVAMDIEVNMGEHDYRIPDPRLAQQEVISVSFVATDGLKVVYVLEREGFTFKKLHKHFPSDAKIYFFTSEKELLTETFRIFWEYPIVITFNGDNFDLNYLYHRAEKLRIDKDLNPIQVKRGFGILSKAECDLRKGIHIDVFNFFFNRSISGYAFSGAYRSASLNAISAALLGKKKYEHEEEIHEMKYGTLSWYNLKDSLLTLELTQFNNSLVWNLIILLCRITKMPIHEMIRRQISTWIQNIFYFEHRRKKLLIPRRSEIAEVKKGGLMMSKANDEKFQGAYVVPPVPGIHFDVVVMDFACFSDDTEILTNHGWFSWGDLKNFNYNNLLLATVNPNNNLIEYYPLNELFEYEYNGRMINIKQHGLDILVTPNHRLVYNKRTNNRDITNFEDKLSIKLAEELKDEYIYSIPFTGDWEGISSSINITGLKWSPSDFLSFLGWFITDGGISGRSVNIYQSKEHNFEHIRTSLKKLGLPYKEYERKRPGKKSEKIFSIHNVPFRDGLINWFTESLGEYKRNRIPPQIFNFKKEELKLLFESMILGDGRWTYNKCYSFDTLNEDMANDFQILCLKLGYGCNIKKEKIYTKFGDKKYKRKNYRCHLSYERKNIIRKHHTKLKNYQGKVWCVSVNNGTVISRRNGKPFVSGNSLYPSIIKEYNLSYETVLCPHKEDKDNLVKGTPYHICTQRMGIFAYVVGFFRDIRVKYFKPKSSDKSLSEKQRSYYNTIQQALKVFINGSYGVFGSQNFPLFCLPVAESTTGIGQYSIKQTIRKAEDIGVQVLYGDSIIGGRCIVIKYNNFINVLPIEEFWEKVDQPVNKINGKEIKVPKDAYTLSLNGNWQKINQIIRHKTTKKIYRINQKNGETICTEDHSLITEDLGVVRPKDIGTRKINFLDNVPHEVSIKEEILDLYPLVKHFSYESEYKGRIKLNSWKADDKYIWFGWTNRTEQKKINRFCNLNDLCKILGIYISDGHASFHIGKYGYKAACGISSQNVEILDDIKEIMERIDFNHKIEIIRVSKRERRIQSYSYEDITHRVQTNSTTWTAFFNSLCGAGSENKHLPSFIFNVEKKYQELLYKYYLIGDGSVEQGKNTFTTKSLQLVSGLCYLLKSWNIDTSIYYYKKRDVYRIRERERVMDLMHPIETRLVELPHEERYVYDLSVKNTEIFVDACGMILLHNTDSVFLANPNKEQLEEISEWSKKELDLDLEEEKTYQFLALSQRKKNYVGIYKDTKHVDIKGLLAKKKNTPDFIKKVFNQLLKILKEIRNENEFLQARQQIIQIVRENLKKIGKPNAFSLEDYAISIALQKKISNYNKTMPQHVRAAIELQNITGREFQKGDTIRLIKSKDSVGAKALEIAKLQDIDIPKYKELLRSALEQVLDALGITFEEIKGIKKMDSFF